MQGFREWFLGTLSLRTGPTRQPTQPIRVTLISRKPYGKKRRVARQISNEDELFAALQQMTNVQAHMVDLAKISLAEQIKLMSANTDVLIGKISSL